MVVVIVVCKSGLVLYELARVGVWSFECNG